MPRRKPFSNKQKKQQLQEKRFKKKEKGHLTDDPTEKTVLAEPECPGLLENPAVEDQECVEDQEGSHDLAKLNAQPLAEPGKAGLMGEALKYNPNRFCLHFGKESNEEIERRKHLAKTVPITFVAEVELESSVEEVYAAGLDFPRRPPWSYAMSKRDLEASEERAFEAYLNVIHSKHTVEQLSYFEHNLETWRQLWRVIEMSDIILLITDIRHPALHFPPAFYRYVVLELKKQLVLVLNKVDLVPPSVGVAWRHYFLSHFPGLDVVCFTSYPRDAPLTHSPGKVKLKMPRKQGKLPSAVGPRELLNLVQKMYSGRVDFSEWRQKLDESTPHGTPPPSMETTPCGATHPPAEYEDCSSGEDGSSGEDAEVAIEGEQFPSVSVVSSSPLVQQDKAGEGILTIGMVGHPNVGKSSIINGLMGKKLVSTSRTPGHTKHFQTLYLTPTLRLCDCPGLVFPSLVDKQLQILSGIYPVAQVREPYTVVGYLAQRTPLAMQLQLVHPEDEGRGHKKTHKRQVGGWEELPGDGKGGAEFPSDPVVEREWTPWDICDAWAIKRGYFTAKAARPDTYKAANSILRLAVEGRIAMHFRPTGFTEKKLDWEGHPEVEEMVTLQRAGLRNRREQLDSDQETEIPAELEAGPVANRKGGGHGVGNKFGTLVDVAAN